MTVLKVVEWPAQVLETKASDVASFDDRLRQFVSDMFETMESAGGIGLAANQVNSLQRVIVLNITSKNEEPEDIRPWHDKKFVLINPVITKKEGKTKYMEGCLSFPEQYDYVDRAALVTVRYQDEHGHFQEFEADGLLAICIQHEMDHIDGIVFINRMSRLKSSRIRKKMLEREQINQMEKDEP
jgi:peptide deformylase